MRRSPPEALYLSCGALFSECRRYRYALWRVWDFDLPQAAFIGLNPSTADESQDDPTLRRCIGYARRWGFGGLVMLNLFAYRTPHPAQLRCVQDPIGAQNDAALARWLPLVRLTIVCWGDQGRWLGRDQAVLRCIAQPFCLRLTRQGNPAHPLFLPADLRPIPFQAGSTSS